MLGLKLIHVSKRGHWEEEQSKLNRTQAAGEVLLIKQISGRKSNGYGLWEEI